MAFRVCKCYHCGEKILTEEDKVRYKRSKDSKTYVNLHKDCVTAYEKSKIEKCKFDECYDYIRFKILDFSPQQQLTNNMRNRILSIRNGTYVNRGVKMKNANGYDYDVILNTLKLSNPIFKRAIVGKGFENVNQKFNYFMAIFMNNVNDVYERMNNKKQARKIIESIPDDDNYETLDIQNKEFALDKKENKVCNLLSDLL